MIYETNSLLQITHQKNSASQFKLDLKKWTIQLEKA